VLEVPAIAISESDARVSIKQVHSTPEGTRGEQIICRQQDAIVAVGPFKQALVIGCDVALVGRVDSHFHARVASGDLPCHVGTVIGRGVVDDEYSHIDPRLVIKHARDGLLEEMTVLVTRDDDAD
jgi:hypothetical protein